MCNGNYFAPQHMVVLYKLDYYYYYYCYYVSASGAVVHGQCEIFGDHLSENV